MSEPETVETPAAQPELLSIEEERGGRWSPFSLGLISNICDPLLIPTILALTRGRSDLREVARREALGIFHEEHARVRTGAVWGIALALGRFALVCVFCFATGIATWLAPKTHSRDTSADVRTHEIDEIQERLHDEADATRALAARHLVEHMRSDVARDSAAGLLEDAWDPSFPPPRNGAPHIPSTIIRAVAERADEVYVDGELAARFVRLYPSLDPAARSAMLRILARSAADEESGTDASHALYTLARAETSAHPELRLPVAELAQLPPDAFATIFALDASVFGADVIRAVALVCRERRTLGDVPIERGYYAPILERARERWSELRVELAVPPAEAGLAGLLDRERRERAEEAATALGVLGCADPDELVSATEAIESADPRVVLAGVQRLHANGEPIPRPVLLRLADEPLVFAGLFETYQDDPEVELTWASEALVRSHLVRHIVDREGFAPSEIVARRPVDAELGEDVRCFAVRGVTDDGLAVEATAVVKSMFFTTDASGFDASELLIEVLDGPYDRARVGAVVERWNFESIERGSS